MPFHSWILDAVDEEVATNHRRVIVPKPEVGNGLVIDWGERECTGIVVDRNFIRDDEEFILNELLFFEDTYN